MSKFRLLKLRFWRVMILFEVGGKGIWSGIQGLHGMELENETSFAISSGLF